MRPGPGFRAGDIELPNTGFRDASSFSRVRPVIWTDWRAGGAAAVAVGWLLSIELRTSRTASRLAAKAPERRERVIDTSTSQFFDAAASTAIIGGISASLASPSSLIRPRRTSFVTGMLLILGSALLSSLARRHLGRFHRASLTIHADHELIESGPYRLVRHPLYSATIGAFVGIGALLGNWISLGLVSLPSLALLHRINVEEEMLVEAFGADYANYRNRTKRVVPWIW